MPRLRNTPKVPSACTPPGGEANTPRAHQSRWKRALRSQGHARVVTSATERAAPQPVSVAPLGPMY